ncbi:MAG: winged helix-turn-helix domain-containing protein [Pseudomonas sp.]|uniref:winged helix-turn-helix domain-containing protein n=1 Tax=unclassified Pseudomonas TaxID=196821 RepID=UPI000731D6AB|nr:winged helix-turn-helix domain-containing protein [Pseudomonas sp. L5B5]KTC34741.1 transcriptional regulator [Pseudomonas sp. ABAC61]UCZ85063.1 winged helix-turn-helix domain-containing protein [Pseudomonas sp. L5B5]
MDNLGLGKVLLVEDDEKLAGLIANFLSQHGFEVLTVHRGDVALSAFLEFKPKLVVLDLMLPGQSGLHVCREIRAVSDTPIVILTAKEDDLDHILGLESGADDYVIKPIKPAVLLARLRALQRRQVTEPAAQRGALQFGVLSIDRSSREVRLGGEPIELTTMEFELLWLLAGSAGNTLSRDDILNRMRGIEFDGLNRSVDVYISKLRHKLKDNPREPVCIKTVWGKGYLFNPFAWEI